MFIAAKFESICPTCTQRIKVGEKVKWNKGEKAKHAECKLLSPEQVIEKQMKSLRSTWEAQFIEEKDGRYYFKRTWKWELIWGTDDEGNEIVVDKKERSISEQKFVYFSTDKCGNNIHSDHDEKRIKELENSIADEKNKFYHWRDFQGVAAIGNAEWELEQIRNKQQVGTYRSHS